MGRQEQLEMESVLLRYASGGRRWLSQTILDSQANTHRDRPQDFEVLLSEGVAHPDSTGEQADHPQQGTNEGEELQGRGVEQHVGPGRGAHQSWTTTTNHSRGEP